MLADVSSTRASVTPSSLPAEIGASVRTSTVPPASSSPAEGAV